MKKVSLYSSSDRTRKGAVPEADAPTERVPQLGNPVRARARWRAYASRHERPLLLVAAALLSLAIVLGHAALTRTSRPVTQDDIDAAVLHTLETAPLPSHAAKAYEAVRRSVVRVHGTGYAKEQEGRAARASAAASSSSTPGSSSPTCTWSRAPTGSRWNSTMGSKPKPRSSASRPEHDLAVLKAEQDPR